MTRQLATTSMTLDWWDPAPGGAGTPDHHHRGEAVLETGRGADATSAKRPL